MVRVHSTLANHNFSCFSFSLESRSEMSTWSNAFPLPPSSSSLPQPNGYGNRKIETKKRAHRSERVASSRVQRTRLELKSLHTCSLAFFNRNLWKWPIHRMAFLGLPTERMMMPLQMEVWHRVCTSKELLIRKIDFECFAHTNGCWVEADAQKKSSSGKMSAEWQHNFHH